MQSAHSSVYKTLLGMLLVHFFVMFVLMYAMINSWDDFIPNLNQAYMAMLMAAPMGVTMLLFMPSMYKDKKVNRLFYIGSGLVLMLFFIFIQKQTLIGDKQFLRSMIPHHSGAILMCGQAKISDSEIAKLCGGIVESQRREIEQMKRILERL